MSLYTVRTHTTEKLSTSSVGSKISTLKSPSIVIELMRKHCIMKWSRTTSQHFQYTTTCTTSEWHVPRHQEWISIAVHKLPHTIELVSYPDPPMEFLHRRVWVRDYHRAEVLGAARCLQTEHHAAAILCECCWVLDLPYLFLHHIMSLQHKIFSLCIPPTFFNKVCSLSRNCVSPLSMLSPHSMI